MNAVLAAGCARPVRGARRFTIRKREKPVSNLCAERLDEGLPPRCGNPVRQALRW
ncbi:hypothetical protein KCP69_22785 [Salmonella enterica subsp. enterica]|nr:hypothetical protein KCP69_22785 [Salmonella enterica subsp. enterica]